MHRKLLSKYTVQALICLLVGIESHGKSTCRDLFVLPASNASSKDSKPEIEFDELILHRAQEHTILIGGTKRLIKDGYSRDQIFYLFKLAASSTPQEQSFSHNLKPNELNYFRTDEVYEIAKLAAQFDGRGVLKYIEKYPGLNNKQYYEIIKIAAKQNGTGVSEFIDKFEWLNKNQLFEVAKMAAAQNGYGTSLLIFNYGKLSPEQKFEIAKIAAAQNGQTLSVLKNYYGMNGDDIWRILKELKYIIDGYSDDVDDFDRWVPAKEVKRKRVIFNQDQIVELTKIAVANDTSNALKNISHIKGLNTEQLLDIALIAARNDGIETIEYINNFQGLSTGHQIEVFITALKNANSYEELDKLSKIFRDKISKKDYPVQLVEMTVPIPFETIDKLSKIHSIDEIKSYIERYGLKTKKASRAQENLIANLVWDRIQKRETGLWLLIEGARLIAQNKTLPKDSLALVSIVSGLELDKLPQNISNDTLGQIYEFTMGIQENLFEPFFSDISIAPEIYAKPNDLLRLLSVLRNYKSLLGNNLHATRELKNIFSERFIDASNLSPFVSTLENKLVDLVKGLFQKGQVNFTYEDFERLNQLWGELEPIFTLASRFKGRIAWSHLISELARVFEASLLNKFKELKFIGDFDNKEHEDGELDKEKAERQMSGLKTKDARNAWMKPRAIVEPIHPISSAQSDMNIKENINQVIQRNLIPHLGITRWSLAHKAISTNANLSELPNFILNIKKDPKEIYQVLLHEITRTLNDENIDPKLVDQIVTLSIVEYIIKSNLGDFSRLLGFIRFLVNNNRLVDINTKTQIEQDLKSIRDLSVKAQSVSNQSLVLTVVNSDPKFLLTIGDAVKTSSCQNYKTGEFIQTLLGYVMDANVQAMVSFLINSNHFRSQTDFTKVFSAIQNKDSVSVSFNGNLKIAIFTLPNGEVINTAPLGYAYLRQMLKLGVNNKKRKAGIYLEPEYLQNTEALNQMRSMHKKLLAEILSETQATSEGPITVYESRNSSGHYSDLASGVMTDTYIVNPR